MSPLWFCKHQETRKMVKSRVNKKDGARIVLGIFLIKLTSAMMRFGKNTRKANKPTQMCHFHQIAIVRRYLTKNPKHKTSQELLLLVKSSTTSNKQCFGKALDEWYDKHKDYLNERTTNDEGKSWYTHKRLGRAYHSLKRNLPYLFVYQQNQITHNTTPNTTNKLEGL